MNEKNIQNNNRNPQPGLERKPNENIGFYFSSQVKIYDPNSGVVLLQKRGDN